MREKYPAISNASCADRRALSWELGFGDANLKLGWIQKNDCLTHASSGPLGTSLDLLRVERGTRKPAVACVHCWCQRCLTRLARPARRGVPC